MRGQSKIFEQIARNHLDNGGGSTPSQQGRTSCFGILRRNGLSALTVGPAFCLHSLRRKGNEILRYNPVILKSDLGSKIRKIPTRTSVATKAITVGEVSLAGKIDRIELGNGMFVIGDYKTGSTTPKLNDILEGRSLQLPLYIAILEQLLSQQSSPIPGFEGDPESVQGVGGVYYVLQEESRTELGIGDRDYNGRAFQVSSRAVSYYPIQAGTN